MPFTVFSAFFVVQSSSRVTHVKNKRGVSTVPPSFLTGLLSWREEAYPTSAPLASMRHQSAHPRSVGRALSICPVTSSSDCGGWRAGQPHLPARCPLIVLLLESPQGSRKEGEKGNATAALGQRQRLSLERGQPTFLVRTESAFLNCRDRHEVRASTHEPPNSFFRPVPSAVLKEISHAA